MQARMIQGCHSYITELSRAYIVYTACGLHTLISDGAYSGGRGRLEGFRVYSDYYGISTTSSQVGIMDRDGLLTTNTCPIHSEDLIDRCVLASLKVWGL